MHDEENDVMKDEEQPAPEVPGKRQGMAREDKLALTLISGLSAVLIVLLMLAARTIMGAFGYVMDTATAGVGFKTAFLVSIGISFFFMLIFALFAGDGVVGELGLMIVGFFVMITFFTLSIALMF